MIAALSVPEHCLSFYFVCDDQIQISGAVWLRSMENLTETFCYLWLTEKLAPPPLPPPPPPHENINYITTSRFSQLGPQLGVGWGKRLSFNRWLKLFNWQIFNLLAFGLRAAVLKLVSFPLYFGCLHCTMALCTWAYYIHCIFKLCASVCLRISVMQKIKICFKQDFLHWIIQKLVKIINILKNNGLVLKNKQKFLRKRIMG